MRFASFALAVPRLMELHGDGGDDVGVEMMRPEASEPSSFAAGCSTWDRMWVKWIFFFLKFVVIT